jgi:hypothetical protein
MRPTTTLLSRPQSRLVRATALWTTFLVPVLVVGGVVARRAPRQPVSAPVLFCPLPSDVDFGGEFAFFGSEQVTLSVTNAAVPRHAQGPYQLAFNTRTGKREAIDIHLASPMLLMGRQEFAPLVRSWDDKVRASYIDKPGVARWMFRHPDQFDYPSVIREVPGVRLTKAILSPKGRYLVGWGDVGANGKQLVIWEQGTHPPRVLMGLGGPSLNVIRFSPDERYLLISHREAELSGELACRELATGKLCWLVGLPATGGKNLQVEDMAVSWDSKYVATAFAQGLAIFDMKTGAPLWQQPRQNGFYPPAMLQFSPDSHLLGESQHDGVALWDWQKGK